MLAGTIISGIQIAFSASNTDGAWENAKKNVEAGKLMRTVDMTIDSNSPTVRKVDKEHQATVCGDT